MKRASVSASGVMPALPDVLTKSRKVFLPLLEALHQSRRIQARRILHQYCHLIGHGGKALSLTGRNSQGNANMIGERSSVRKEAARLSMPGEMTLLTVIVFGFLLLHIFTGVLLLSGERKSPEQASLSLSD